MNTTKYLSTIAAIAFLGAQLLTSAPATRADETAVAARPPIGLVLLDKLMSGRSKEGDVVHFETLADVYGDHNNLLVPAGCSAVGYVTRSKGSGMFGKAGKIEFTCEYVILPDNTHVSLTGARLGASGANGGAATVAVTVLVSPLGLLIKGGTSIVDRGTPVEMYVADAAKEYPLNHQSTGLYADFALRDKNASDVVGTITGFDGDSYTVVSTTEKRKLHQDDIASITIESPPSVAR